MAPHLASHTFADGKPFLLGLLHWRSLLVPTLRGWLLLTCLALALGAFLIKEAYSFLSPDLPLPEGLLVVSGAADDGVLDEAALLVRRGTYGQLLVTGTRIDKGQPLLPYGSTGDLGMERLKKFMKGRTPAGPVPVLETKADESFACANSVREWLNAHGGIPREITVFCCPASSRRTRLAYTSVLGSQTRIGMIVVPPNDYDPRRWWLSSAGVRDMVGEAISYAYVRVGCGRPMRE